MTVANLSAIRDGIKARLVTISGLRASDLLADAINPPEAVVGGPELINFDVTYGRGADRFTLPVRVYASRASERAGQDKLDSYLMTSGATSIKAAIEGDKTLGGTVHSVRVTLARGYGAYTIGDVTYLGAEFVLDIIAPST